VYQLSVNNFSRNRLFTKYALEDLADMLKIKILVFRSNPTGASPVAGSGPTILTCMYDGTNVANVFDHQLNDFVYLSVSEQTCPDSSVYATYNWMLPKTKQALINRTVLSPDENFDNYFIRLHHQPFFYTHNAIVVDLAHLFACFSHECLVSNVCVFLYMRFLSECGVDTLVSVDELNFGELVMSRDVKGMCHYLNRLSGERRFDPEYYANFAALTSNLLRTFVNIHQILI
jgi:hypothetical protein